jgi:hypothetical protein
MKRPFFFSPAAALASFALVVSGCATPHGTYGNVARYSPAFRGYVLAAAHGSDDPAPGDAVLVMRDPLTGDKLRCQEEVVAWRELHEDLAVERLRDERAALTAAGTAGLLFVPLIVAQPLGALGMTEALWSGALIYEDLRSDDAWLLLRKGRALYERTRYSAAASYLEHALAKDAAVGIADEAYFYLGMSYAKLGDNRARLALALFITRAAVRDVEAFRAAEATLATLGARPESCESTASVALHW